MADEEDQGLGAAPSDPITKQGWMQKKGGHRRNWNKRWFVMKGAFLYYYTDENCFITGVRHKGVIPLKDVLCQIFFHRKRNFCFEVQHDERRTFYLQADTEEDKYDWIEAISAASMGPVNAPITVSQYYEILQLPESPRTTRISTNLFIAIPCRTSRVPYKTANQKIMRILTACGSRHPIWEASRSTSVV